MRKDRIRLPKQPYERNEALLIKLWNSTELPKPVKWFEREQSHYPYGFDRDEEMTIDEFLEHIDAPESIILNIGYKDKANLIEYAVCVQNIRERCKLLAIFQVQLNGMTYEFFRSLIEEIYNDDIETIDL